MNRGAPPLRSSSSQTLPGLPREELSAEQRLAALQRIQDQAEQRVQLGMQLFKAAQAHTATSRGVLDQIKSETDKVREQIQEDVARSLHTYDQWVGELDEGFNKSLRSIEERIDKLQNDWLKTQQRIDSMIKRSEALLDQSRCMVESSGASPGKGLAAAVRPVDVSKPGVNAPAPAVVVASATETKVAAPTADSPVQPAAPLPAAQAPASECGPRAEVFRQALAELNKRDERAA